MFEGYSQFAVKKKLILHYKVAAVYFGHHTKYIGVPRGKENF